jgi:hypothetical protein
MSLTDEDKRWITQTLEAMDARFSEKLERMETRVLRAIRNEPSPQESRARIRAALRHVMDLELESNDLLSKLEPPH